MGIGSWISPGCRRRKHSRTLCLSATILQLTHWSSEYCAGSADAILPPKSRAFGVSYVHHVRPFGCPKRRYGMARWSGRPLLTSVVDERSQIEAQATQTASYASSPPLPSMPSNRVSPSSGKEAPSRPNESLQGKMDPWRPTQTPIDPVVINLLVKILSSNEDAERVANAAIRKRMRKKNSVLTLEERKLIYKRIYGVEVLRKRLLYLLEHAVRSSSLIDARFGPSEADFGLPVNASGDPMLLVNRAESLLALYMMTEEGAEVDFLDTDRLEVLSLVGDKASAERVFEQIRDDVERISAQRSFPEWLIRCWIEQYGVEGADALATRLNERPPITLRVNTLKTTREAVSEELSRREISAIPTRFSPWGLTLNAGDEGIRIFDQDFHKLGYVDLMNEASQCAALSTGAKPYDIVLVYGAKKGLKALALASMLRGNGMIYLWEEFTRQIHQIKEVVRRAGLRDLVEVLPNVNAAMRIKADVVLVDAICSNTGALAHHPSMRWKKADSSLLEKLVAQQRLDLQNAARAVSPGGVLVYSTCSLLESENQGVTDWFEQEFSREFEPLNFDKNSVAGGNQRALLPHIHQIDGAYIAKWRRKKNDQAG